MKVGRTICPANVTLSEAICLWPLRRTRKTICRLPSIHKIRKRRWWWWQKLGRRQGCLEARWTSSRIRRCQMQPPTANLTCWTYLDEAGNEFFRHPGFFFCCQTSNTDRRHGMRQSWQKGRNMAECHIANGGVALYYHDNNMIPYHEYIWRTWAEVLSLPPCWHCWCALVRILKSFSRIATGFPSWQINFSD